MFFQNTMPAFLKYIIVDFMNQTTRNSVGRPSKWPEEPVHQFSYKSTETLYLKLCSKRDELKELGLDVNLSDIQEACVRENIETAERYFR